MKTFCEKRDRSILFGDKDVIDTELQLKDLESVEKKNSAYRKISQDRRCKNESGVWRYLRDVTSIGEREKHS
jgi:hypothetical protein